MISTTEGAIAEIRNQIAKCGGYYSGWYVGIAADARDRLFRDHRVSENADSWIFRNCGNSTVARAVEQYFLNQGADGGTGGGDYKTIFVYAYKKAYHTNP